VMGAFPHCYPRAAGKSPGSSSSDDEQAIELGSYFT